MTDAAPRRQQKLNFNEMVGLSSMQCPRCQAENREGRRFCGKCGAALSVTCPACGFVNEPDEAYCGGCGSAIGPSAAAATRDPPSESARPSPPTSAPGEASPVSSSAVTDAERRQLTVMFCDLAGSTALSEQLDPEDLRDVLAVYQRTCTEVVARFQGYIARYVGDGLLIYFGYPQAHEDDAERAVRAGLEIAAAVSQLEHGEGAGLQVRVGIATGRVVVGEIIGRGAAQERAVVGETPNLAARLQALAQPNSVVISQRTLQLIGGRFELESLGEVRVKGISEPVTAWRVLEESKTRSRLEASTTRGISSLVGRREEIELLQRRWVQAREGEGQVVYLSGGAGIGKSRVLRGFQDKIENEYFSRILYFCSPYHQDTALFPVIDQLKRILRFEKRDDNSEKLKKLENVLGNLDLSVADYAPPIASLLSLPSGNRYPPLALPPGEIMAKTLEALVAMTEAACSKGPVLMIAEDVHWADSSTQELLGLLMSRATELPMLLLATFRPGFEIPWQEHGHETLITLNRLSRGETTELITNVAGGKTLPPELVKEIVAKTDGVPLFVEELTKAVLESSFLEEAHGKYRLTCPLPTLEVPASLQDSLMARLDRLGPVKEVAQLAAAIGRSFSLELLSAVAEMEDQELEAALARLMGAELVNRRSVTPEIIYEFKHALVRDAAYTSLLRRARESYHLRIARALEQHFAHTITSEPALLAHHYSEAGVTEKAVEYWLKAGKLLHDKGSVAMSMAAYRRAFNATEDGVGRCRALLGLAGGMRVTDEYQSALDSLKEAQLLAQEHNLMAELAQIHHLRGNLYFPLGKVTECLEEHEQALRYARKIGDHEDEARALSGLGDAYYSQGRMKTSLEYFRRCIDLSRTHGYLHIEVGNHYMVSWTRFYMNEVMEARADALEAVASAERIGYLRAEMVARLTASRVLLELGDLDAALTHVERGLSIAERLGANRFKPFLMIFLARAGFARDGFRQETVELMEQAEKISSETSIGFVGPWVMCTRALVSSDGDEIKKALSRGEEILAGQCVGHNYFAFYHTAMEVSRREKWWDEVERYADALEAFSRPEPLPRCDFYIARARALVRWGREGPSDEVRSTLAALRAQAVEIGLNSALPALDEALGGGSVRHEARLK